jgi:hypothetical protein
MKLSEIEPGQAVLFGDKPCTVVGTHTDQSSPGRYTKRVMVLFADKRSGSVTAKNLRRANG